MKPSALLLLLLLFGPVAFAGPLLTEDFSVSEGKTAGEPIGVHPGWFAVPHEAAVVTSSDWMTGGQSLVLLPGTPVVEAVRELPLGIDPLYLEFQIRPVFGDGSASPAVEVEGARLGFVREGAVGTAVAGAEAAPVRIAEPVFGVRSDGVAARWLRVGLELRRGAGAWSLSLDGNAVLGGQPPAPGSFPGEIVFYGDSEGPVYLDALRIGATPFAESEEEREATVETESEVGTAPYLASDAKEESQDTSHISPHKLDMPLPEDATVATLSSFESPATVYVDNAVGDDAFDGRAGIPEGAGSGPVATLAAALARVKDGGTIVIHERVDSYIGSLGNLNGRTVSIETVGNVRVRSKSATDH